MPPIDKDGAGDRWNIFVKRIRDDAANLTTVADVIRYAQTKIQFDHRTPAGLFYPTLDLSLGLLRAEFPEYRDLIDYFGDSPYSQGATMVELNGRLLSNVSLFQLRYMLSCLRYAGNPRRICEIGGGYGALARMFTMNPNHVPQRYVIVDMPESLFFAEVFLRASLPDVHLDYVRDGGFNRDAAILLCPISAIDSIRDLQFDIVINTGSMQEMTEAWVDYWMVWLDSIHVGFFYSLNYFAQPLNNWAEGRNTWSPRLSRQWTVRYQCFNPAFVRTQTVRNYAEIVAERTPERVDDVEARYMRTQLLFLDGQTMLEAFNIIRLGASDDILWDLLHRCLTVPEIPKEAMYLSSRLADSSRYGAQAREIHANFESIKQVTIPA